jgi:hypothetical protein
VIALSSGLRVAPRLVALALCVDAPRRQEVVNATVLESRKSSRKNKFWKIFGNFFPAARTTIVASRGARRVTSARCANAARRAVALHCRAASEDCRRRENFAARDSLLFLGEFVIFLPAHQHNDGAAKTIVATVAACSSRCGRQRRSSHCLKRVRVGETAAHRCVVASRRDEKSRRTAKMFLHKNGSAIR